MNTSEPSKQTPPEPPAGATLRKAPAAPKPTGWKMPLLLGAVVVVGAALYLEFSRSKTPHPAPPSQGAQGPVPAGIQPYLEQAKSGDAHAMRMLGVMYYYGLNVPQDREQGLYWYRKAAEKGSDAARAELARIEGGL